ncbi:hypothetical protein LCGC14_0390140 [marine sediment metagenome]|uniref:Uncharacterized protein n=1 Tax=marine sediment metagenome TaxID=412755 RepID=A0A0F9THV6_9ZZZZ
MMFRRIANDIQMSCDIPDNEKEDVLQAKMQFEAAAKALNVAVEHLDHIYDPFVAQTDISTESVVNNRGVLQGRYSTRVKDNFNEVKTHALMGIRKLNKFTTGDNVVRELINTFVDSIGDVEGFVEAFLNTLKNDIQSSDFRDKVISTIDQIKKQAAELDEFIYDTIIEHIDRDFLTKTWMNETGDELSIDINKTELPLVTRLREEREKALNPDAFPAPEAPGQSLNMSDAQRMLYPNRMPGDTNMGNFGE